MIGSEPTADVADDLARDLVALVDAPRYRPGPPCSVAAVLRRLADDSPDAAAAAKQLLDNDTVRASRIAETLTKHGHPVAAQSVSRHRRRGQHNGCRCPR